MLVVMKTRIGESSQRVVTKMMLPVEVTKRCKLPNRRILLLGARILVVFLLVDSWRPSEKRSVQRGKVGGRLYHHCEHTLLDIEGAYRESRRKTLLS